MCERLEAKDRRRMAAKYNRRSYLDYTAKGLYGPKCIVVPNADPQYVDDPHYKAVMFVAEGWRLHKCCVTHIIDLIKAVSFVSSDVMVAKKAALVTYCSNHGSRSRVMVTLVTVISLVKEEVKAQGEEEKEEEEGEEGGREANPEESSSCELHLQWLCPPCTLLVIKKISDEEATRWFKELTTWIVQEKRLSVVVEPAVLQEPLVKGDHTYCRVLSNLTTWGQDCSQEEVLRTVDLIVCIGGDGTLLYTSTLFPERIPPIIGFHMGSLGFLTPFQLDSYKSTIDRVLGGDASVTLRYRLNCDIRSPLQSQPLTPGQCNGHETEMVEASHAVSMTSIRDSRLIVNEVVVDRGTSPYLTNLEVSCNERLITTVQGDGLIVATPTGSTAYSLAAGASMVHPSVPCMIITPICPHSLSFRPIVVPAGVEILIRVAPESRSSAWVAIDGRNRQEIKQGDSVVVTNSSWSIPTINNTGHVTDWFDSLAVCLNWNSRKTQKDFRF